MISDHSAWSLLAKDLRETVHAALPKLSAISSADAVRPLSPGKWSPAQIIGHLIDSAANNHQRFIRAQQDRALVFPGYAQEHWVGVQFYNDRPWPDLVDFWAAYHRHLAHVIEHMPEDRRDAACTIGSDEPVTLGFLVHDYAVHMRHHLTQIGA
jgi:hypothetical protein